MSDDLAATNRAQWNALVDANVEYSRPMLDLTPESARAEVDPLGLIGDVRGKQVLCLASGGGQQSVAFALLGAEVTVYDLSDKQLERDLQAAAHYGISIRAIQGDMRQLDALASASFDLVYQAFSINFVPKVDPVIAEVARVCRPGALYHIVWFNPFVQTIDSDRFATSRDWNGSGYLLRYEYIDGRETTALFPTWSVDDQAGNNREVESPREFAHTLSTMINTLASNGFAIVRASESSGDEGEAAPGSWQHFLRVCVPYLTLWSRYTSLNKS